MKKRMTKYKVFDRELGDIVAERITSDQVADITGVEPNYISDYASKGKLAKRRYQIIRERDQSDLVPRHLTTSDRQFINEYNAAMKALKQNYTKEQLSRIKITAAIEGEGAQDEY